MARTYEELLEYNRQWREKNREKIREYNKRNYEKRKASGTHARWRNANKDKCNLYARRFRAKSPEYYQRQLELNRKNAHKRYWRRRNQWLEDNPNCVQCGSTDQLEADHIDPTTKVADDYWNWSEKKFQAELAKCQALCKPCHKEKTIKQISKS